MDGINKRNAISNLDSFIEDMIPRSSPVAGQYTPMAQMCPSVPEISLFLPSDIDPVTHELSKTSHTPDYHNHPIWTEIDNVLLKTTPGFTVESDADGNFAKYNYDPHAFQSKLSVNLGTGDEFDDDDEETLIQKHQQKLAELEAKFLKFELFTEHEKMNCYSVYAYVKSLNHTVVMQAKEIIKIKVDAIEMRKRMKDLEDKVAKSLSDKRMEQSGDGPVAAVLSSGEVSSFGDNAIDSTFTDTSSCNNVSDLGAEINHPLSHCKISVVIDEDKMTDMSQATFDYMKRHGLINAAPNHPSVVSIRVSPKVPAGTKAHSSKPPISVSPKGATKKRNKNLQQKHKQDTKNILNIEEIKKQPKFKIDEKKKYNRMHYDHILMLIEMFVCLSFIKITS